MKSYSLLEKHAQQDVYRINNSLLQHPFFLPRARDAHKGDFGKLLLVGGHAGMGGAIRLSGEASMRCGTGLVVVASHPSNQLALTTACPELMTQAVEHVDDLQQRIAWCDHIALGPGLGRDAWSEALFNHLFTQGKLAVLDADALYWLALRDRGDVPAQSCIITPHAGEAARLLSCSITDIEQDRIDAVKSLAQQYQVIAVLKGRNSLISDGNQVFMVSAGNPGMASAGMGDVLTGIISALVAQKVAALDAACLGVWLHATAGDCVAQEFGEKGMRASDLFPYIRQLINGK